MLSGPEYPALAADPTVGMPASGVSCRPDGAARASVEQFASAIGGRLESLGRAFNSVSSFLGAYALIGLVYGAAWLDDRHRAAAPVKHAGNSPPAQITPVPQVRPLAEVLPPLIPSSADITPGEPPAWLSNFLAQPGPEAAGRPEVPAWVLSESGTALPVARRIVDQTAADRTIYRIARLRAGTTTTARYVPIDAYPEFVADWLSRNSDGKVI